MRWGSPLLLLLFFSVSSGTVRSEVRICSYNVERFNVKKASNSRLINTLTRVVSRCDVCLLLDVVESKAVDVLLKALNRPTDRYDGFHYTAVSSKSLGNSPNNMQQYVFIYRTETVNVTGQHQDQRPSFVRAPFVVQFQTRKTVIKTFVLVALLSEPPQAVQELDHLYDIFQEVGKRWNNTNVMFLGNFHAGCAYVTRSDRKHIRLYKDPNMVWLITDKMDTTVTKETNCPYDRIVVYGEHFLKGIKASSAKVFNIGKEFKLSQSKVLDLSSHLPVEVMLRSSAIFLQATPLLVLLGVSVVMQCVLSAL